MRPLLPLLCVCTAALPACGTILGVTAGDVATTTGDSASDTFTEEPTDGASAAVAWSTELAGCGGLYNMVLLPGGDLVAVGERRDQGDETTHPFAVRYTADGQEVWMTELGVEVPNGSFSAVALTGTEEVAAVGHVRSNNLSFPLVARLGSDGALLWTRQGEPEKGVLHGAAWSEGQATLWTTGSSLGDLLVAGYDADGALGPTLPAPEGSNDLPGIGYAAALVDDELFVCGRSPTESGGQLWVARYDAEGAEVWSTLGPDPGPGALTDCWDMAAAPDLTAVTVEAGYLGARVAWHDAAGEPQWIYVEPHAGAQAVDIDANGEILVAGWTAFHFEEASSGPQLRSGEQHGWLRRFSADGEDLGHTWLGIKHLSPRDLKVITGGEAVLVGERLPPGGCSVPWLARASG